MHRFVTNFKNKIHLNCDFPACVDVKVVLHIQAENVIEALNSSEVSERQVCVQWWKLGRWFYGFRLRDEFHLRNVSLGDLTVSKEEVLGVLHRGAVHEVIRVQISAAKSTHTSWSHQVAHV